MTRPPRTNDLDGNAPDTSPVVLLVIDAINDFTFEGAREVLAGARPMAGRIRRLKSLARRVGVPTVYVNDNLGRWRSDFRKVVAHCGGTTGVVSWRPGHYAVRRHDELVAEHVGVLRGEEHADVGEQAREQESTFGAGGRRLDAETAQGVCPRVSCRISRAALIHRRRSA